MKQVLRAIVTVAFLIAPALAGADIWQDPAFEKLSRAIELFNANELDAAEKLATESLVLYPDNIITRYLLGEIDLEKERWQEAAAQFGRVLELYPDFAEAHRKLAAALAASKDYAKARAAFAKALALSGEDAETLKGLAFCTGELGQTKLAIDYYRRALAKLGGRDVDTLLALANLYEKAGQLGDAIRTLRFLISIEKTHERVKRLAILFHNDGDYKAALPLLEELVKAGNADADVLYCLGMSRHSLGDKDGAIEALENTIAADPSYLEAHYNLAVVYVEKKLVPRALAELEKAVAIDPHFVLGYQTLGRIHEHYTYDIEEAKRWYAKAREAEDALATQPASRPAASRPAH